MGKKRKTKQIRPWCWYCEKDFEDDKVLVTHQRAKHFKCEECGKKLTTAGGMVVHAHQVHKIGINKVPNAMPGRDNLDIEIFGMEGIPEEDLIAYEAKMLGASNSAKKSKSGGSGQYGELTLEEMQQQMAAHKAGTNPVGAPAAPAAPVTATPAIPTPAPVTTFQQPQVATSHYYNPAFGVPPPQAGYGGVYPYPNPYYPPAQPNYGFRPPPGAPGFSPANPWGGYGMPPYGVPGPAVPASTPQSTIPPASAPPPAVPATFNPTNQSTTVNHSPQSSQPQQQQQQQHKTEPGGAAEGTPQGSSKKKASKIVLIYNNNEVSPEEQRGQLEKYRLKV
ncbi:hypothetical protein K501DRAFT_251996 [Backusella circina FSU 941]|nr:hypothetical protein K501DRAFT_251996 [Backusella circina FSU 941]